MNVPFFDPRSFADLPLSFPFPGTLPAPGRTLLLALGKAAFLMTDRFLREHPAYRSSPLIVIAPEGLDTSPATLPPHAEVVYSTHPHLTEKSFAAGRELVSFVTAHTTTCETVVTLLSGGASALVEHAPDPARVIAEHRRLLYGGLPIEEINRRRIALSDIKGGKLTRIAPRTRWTTFVMSDIPAPDGYRSVGSMPTYLPGEPGHLLVPVADGGSLHEFCAEKLRQSGYHVAVEERFLTGTVDAWSRRIATQQLAPGEALLFTGEPTVTVTPAEPGIGGRMAQLALLLIADGLNEGLTLHALSSDGIDGNSSYAGVIFTPRERTRFDRTLVAGHLARFDAYPFFERYSCAVRTGRTGVNLNDVVIVSRD